MAYGLDHRLFVENGPAVQADLAGRQTSARAFAAWRFLAPEARLAAVDRALNDNLGDGLPIAL